MLHRIQISEVGLLVIFDLTILKNKLIYRIIDTYLSNSLSKVEATRGLKILVSNVLEPSSGFWSRLPLYALKILTPLRLLRLYRVCEVDRGEND